MSRAALALSATVFTFVQATRNIDQTVHALYEETTGLNRTIDAINGSLANTNISESVHAAQYHALWKSVIGSLSDCRDTVERMSEALKGVQQRQSNIATQAFRTLKLNLKEEQINSLRTQIQRHNTTLQLALQTINV